MATPSPPPATPQRAKCLGCGTPLEWLRPEQLGLRGTDLPFFKGFMEYGQSMQPLLYLVCPACRRIELRLR